MFILIITIMKKNRKIYNRIGLILFAGVLSVMNWSCSDEFLESFPQNELSAATFYKTNADFEKAANGIYRTLAEKDGSDAQDEFRYAPMLDCATPYVSTGKSRYGVWDFGTMDINSNWKVADPVWKTYYRMINRSNELIRAIDENEVEGLDANILQRSKGEALFLRALAYFYLTDFFGDVPLITAIQTIENIHIAASPKSAVIEQVISDLQASINLLPSVTTFRGTGNLGRATKGAAQGLLGKVFVFEERYGEAATVLNTLITGGDYMLTPGPAGYIDQFWPQGDNNIESLFEIQYNLTDGNNYTRFCASQNSGMHVKGYNYVGPRQLLMDKFETTNGGKVTSTYTHTDGAYMIFDTTSDDPSYDPNDPFVNRDPRLTWTAFYDGTPYVEEFMQRTGQTGVSYSRADNSMESNYTTVKYICGNTYDLTGSDSEVNFKILRYADVLLLYAEALLEGNSDAGGAATYINMVRSRESVNMPNITATSVADVRTALRDERIRELACEYGHIYQDMRRWGTYPKAMEDFWTANKEGFTNPALGTYDTNYLIWPIPQTELDTNPLLKQNPGY